MGVIHRDVKPENVLLSSKIDKSTPIDQISVKIIDFGLSIPFSEKYFKDWKKIGTLFYLAPEVFSGVYSTKCDSWGCGILASLLLLGFNPFYEEDDEHILKKINTYRLEKAELWNNLTIDEQKILESLLNKNYFLRGEADFILNYKYFSHIKPTLSAKEKKKILSKLSNFKMTRCSLVDIAHYYLSFRKITEKQ